MNRRTRTRLSILVGAVSGGVVAAVACTDTLQGGLAIVTGPDNGFLQSPQPTSLLIQLINPVTGQADAIARTSLAAADGNITLPSQPGANVEVIQMTGFDDAGTAVVSGSTIPLALDQLDGITLNVFVQRTGQFSRLPDLDGSAARVTLPSTSPILTILESRYLLVSKSNGKPDPDSGTMTATALYDTLSWQADQLPPLLPISPLSVAYVDTWTGTDAAIDADSISAILSLGANGAATWLDITDSTEADAEVTFEAGVPSGHTFVDVAGGKTIVTGLPNNNTYVVGATRLSGGATTGVLRISPSGILTWATLQYPRLGAAAAFANGNLYVFGGTTPGDGGEAGSAAPGVEILADTSSMAHASGPTDTTTGAGAVALDSQTILLAGGVTADGKAAPVRLVSLGADAGTTTWQPLPETLVTAQSFGLTGPDSGSDAGASAIVVGTAKSGTSYAYVVTAGGVTPVAFHAPRTNAQATVLPNGSLVVVGGDSGTLESFIR